MISDDSPSDMSVPLVDVEAPCARRQWLQEEGVHKTLQSPESERVDPVRIQRIEDVKKQLMNCRSLSHLKDVATEEIDTAWMGHLNDFPGNIYDILAFEDMSLDRYQKIGLLTRDAGFFTIWVIQVIGPPAIFLSTVFGWGIMCDQKFRWHEWEPNFVDWQHISLTKTLGLFLIFGFCLNGRYVILDEHKSWRKLERTFAYLEGEDISIRGQEWIWLGSCMNCWVVLWCCFDAIIIIGASMNPKDMLFDSVGLLFMYNLDDVCGDFGFVSVKDWPGDRFSWIYENMVEPEYEKTDEDDDEIGCCCIFGEDMHFLSKTVEVIYAVTQILLVFIVFLIPIFCSITSFSTIRPKT